MSDKYFKAIDPNEWIRNPQWVQIPLDNGLDNKMYGVYAVFEDEYNVASMLVFGVSDIDWGDGNTETGILSPSSTNYYNVYDYATIPGPILVHRNGGNYKTVLVEVTSDNSSYQSYFQMDDKPPFDTGPSHWLDVVFRVNGTSTDSSSANSYSFSFGGGTRYCPLLERISAKYPISDYGFSRGLRNCFSLSKLDVPSDMFNYITIGSDNIFTSVGALSTARLVFPSINNSNLVGLFSMARNSARCEFGDLNLPGLVDITSLNIHCNLYKVGNVTLPDATEINYLFGGTVGAALIEGIGIIDAPNATRIDYALRGCKMTDVEFTDLSNCTIANNLFGNSAGNVKRLITPNLTVSLDARENNLDATAINDWFTSLGTAAGTQTVNVSDNPGSATCDTTIATAKGWIVIT